MEIFTKELKQEENDRVSLEKVEFLNKRLIKGEMKTCTFYFKDTNIFCQKVKFVTSKSVLMCLIYSFHSLK